MIESQGHLTAQPYSDKSDHIGEAKKMIGEFERVIIRASKMYGSLVNTLLLDLANAHLFDIAAKDKRISWLEEYANAKDVSVTEEMHQANEAEARIMELEARVSELTDELKEELQEVICFAPECTSSKDYAEKRLAELMQGGK